MSGDRARCSATRQNRAVSVTVRRQFEHLNKFGIADPSDAFVGRWLIRVGDADGGAAVQSVSMVPLG